MTFDELNDLFEQQINEHRYEDAKATAERIIREYSKRSTGWGYLAFVQLRQGDLPSAKESALTAIKINPNNPCAYHWLGQVASANEEYEDAIEHFTNSIINDRIGVQIYYDRAQAYAKLGLKSEAHADLLWVLKLDENEYETVQQLMLDYKLIAADDSFKEVATPIKNTSTKRLAQNDDDDNEDDDDLSLTTDSKRRKVGGDKEFDPKQAAIEGLCTQVSILREQLQQVTVQLRTFTQISEHRTTSENLQNRILQLETAPTANLLQELTTQVNAVQHQQAAHAAHLAQLSTETLDCHERLLGQEVSTQTLSDKVNRLAQREVLALAPTNFFAFRSDEGRTATRPPVVAGTPRNA